MYGPFPQAQVPVQDEAKLMLLAERWQRAAFPHARWAEPAQECVDFFEGRQWTEDQLRELEKQKRPKVTMNKIAPLVRLVLGYHRNNRQDIRHIPGNDGAGTVLVADTLTMIEKQIAEMNQLEQEAHIKDFVPLQVIKQVKDLLRAHQSLPL